MMTDEVLTEDQVNTVPEVINLVGDWEFREVQINGEFINPYYSLLIRNHSPDGFNWGYGGSGPAQLALAILMEYLPVKFADKYYQQFKWQCIATLPQESINVDIYLRQFVKGENDKQIDHNLKLTE